MITKQEIMDSSREFSLSANTIEKDYVLGWLLAGIASHTELFNTWIFKGGTCLKKCYFETYRFSEDLDYTLIDKKQIDEKYLVNCFKQISAWIYDMAGIEIPEETIRFEVYQNSAGKVSVEGRVHYIGPMQRKNNPFRIKLDLTAEEILVLPATQRNVHHPYSDMPKEEIKAYCYTFSEIFAEKIRALSERARPRDLYDVIHLYRHAIPGAQSKPIVEVLKEKCEYKAIPMPTMTLIEAHSKFHELETEWESMLAHQLPILPPREQFLQELPDLFTWLYGDRSKIIRETAPFSPKEKIDHTWAPPSMIQAWHMTVSFELIRYAGANHLCAQIEYNNTTYLIEPYNLQRTQAGQLLLIAVQHETKECQSYDVNEIKNIVITKTSFIPRYAISLTPFTETH